MSDTKDFQVRLNDKIMIDFDEPLPEYNQDPLKAYHAIYKSNETFDCYAIVCDRALPPRISLAEAYMSKDFTNVARLIGHGPVMDPHQDKEQYIFVYDASYKGKKLVERESSSTHLGMAPNTVMDKVVPSFINALLYLDTLRMCHGSICLSNMYAHYQEGVLIDISLGDSLSLPCGYGQNILYRTVQAARVDVNGFGQGSIKDDIYAFGVCLALMLRQINACEGMDDDDILKSKAKYGTYATLVNKERFGNAFLELLKGILQDDETKRWGIEELTLWQDGRTLTPLQPTRSRVAPRSLKFNGGIYEKYDLLARDLHHNVTEAHELILTDKLGQWIERSVNDAQLTRRYEEALSMVRSNLKPDEQAEVMVSLVSAALDPGGPIYYRNMLFYPYGVSTKIIEAFEKGNSVNVFASVFRNNVIMNWFRFQNPYGSSLATLIKDIEKCVSYIRNTKIGFGLERSAYRLDRHIPCMSPFFDKYYVQHAKDLAEVAEKTISDEKDSAYRLMDRHVAGFLMERDPKVIEDQLHSLDKGDKSAKIIAILCVYADIQRRYRLGKLPTIAMAFAKSMAACYEKFHDKDYRKTLSEQVIAEAKKGGLIGLLNLVNDGVAIDRDRNHYMAAKSEYIALEKEKLELQDNMIDREAYTMQQGRRLAAIIAGIISTFVVLLIVFVNLFGIGGASV